MTIISKTKKVLNNKIVRLVFFLLVIVSIITGIAFGIMALVKSITDPCSQQPNSTFCKKTGLCIKNDYCPKPYIFDPESCECTIDCSSQGEGLQPFTLDGKSSTTIRIDNGYRIPNEELTCGMPCEYSKVKQSINIGGIGWCAEDYHCGYSIDDNNPPLKPYDGLCIPSTYDKCSKKNKLYCENNSDCNTDGNSCKFETCGTSDPNMKIACTKPEDCYQDGIAIPGTDCTIISAKNYKKVGYCTKTNLSKDLQNCINIDLIGETSSGEYVDCSNQKSNYHDVKGITRTIGQCQNNISAGKTGELACATYGICNNNTGLALDSDQKLTDSICTSTPKDCSGIEECWASTTDCCLVGHLADDPNPLVDTKYCCPTKTTPTQISGKNKNMCYATTKHPYSKLMLLGSGALGEPITPKIGADPQAEINSYNVKLRKQLGTTSKNPGDKDFVTTYWNNGVLYATAGFATLPTGTTSTYLIQNNENLSISYITKKSTCQITTVRPSSGYEFSTGLNTPVCKDDINNYWTNLNNQADNSKFSVFGNVINSTTQGPCSGQEIYDTCANHANMYGFNELSVSGNECTFNADCKNLKLTGFTKSSGSVTENVGWSEFGSLLEDTSFAKNQINSHSELKNFIARDGPYNISSSCEGQSPFSQDLTWSPAKPNKVNNDCISNKPINKHFLKDGTYCPKGVAAWVSHSGQDETKCNR